MKPYVGNHLTTHMCVELFDKIRPLHREVCPQGRIRQMHIERLVTDDDPVGISVDDFTGDEGPGINQTFLHQGHLQPLSAQIPQNQTLDILYVSFEHLVELRITSDDTIFHMEDAVVV